MPPTISHLLCSHPVTKLKQQQQSNQGGIKVEQSKRYKQRGTV